MRVYFVKKPVFGVIHSSAVIDFSVKYNNTEVIIGPNVVIEENVQIGLKVSIGANSVIKANTIIHDNVSIGCNCTIGGVGFGYEPNEEGLYELIPHIGNVVLYESVEIGNNVSVSEDVNFLTADHNEDLLGVLGRIKKIDKLILR